MKISILPTIREIYKNQFELTVDRRLIKFLEKNFKKSKIDIIKDENLNYKYDLLVISGGNDLPILNNLKKNKIRNALDNKHFEFAKKKGKKILGICHGSQFIAHKFRGKLIKNIKLKTNNLFTSDKRIFKTKLYHNYSITYLPKSILILAKTKDEMIEAFRIKNHLIYGIMWHPERNSNLNEIDKNIIDDLCN